MPVSKAAPHPEAPFAAGKRPRRMLQDASNGALWNVLRGRFAAPQDEVTGFWVRLSDGIAEPGCETGVAQLFAKICNPCYRLPIRRREPVPKPGRPAVRKETKQRLRHSAHNLRQDQIFYVTPKVIPNNRRRRLHGLILRSDAQHRVSKDGPARSLVRAPWSVLRDAALRAAPQDEGGLGVTLFGLPVTH